jgi:hypothetical protein
VRAYGNAAVAAEAATEATCVLDIVVTRRCRAHLCVRRGASPREGANDSQCPCVACSEPKKTLTTFAIW